LKGQLEGAFERVALLTAENEALRNENNALLAKCTKLETEKDQASSELERCKEQEGARSARIQELYSLHKETMLILQARTLSTSK
jgi:FtsZ-binding cell division protein ZapB